MSNFVDFATTIFLDKTVSRHYDIHCKGCNELVRKYR